MSNKRLLDILRDYILNDLEVADPEYVRTVLTDVCSCSGEEIYEIGLDWLFPEAPSLL